MNGQTEAGKPLRQDVHHPAGVGFQCAADDEIIRKTREKALALHPGLHAFDKPFVQDSMQEYIRHHRRDHAALRCTLVRVTQCSRLEYACMEPLAEESQYSPITDPLLDKLSQMTPVQVVKKSTDICIHYPRNVQRPTLLTQFVKRLVLTVPFSEAMGELMKLRLEDGLQNHYHRSLDNLVLEAGVAYRPLFPIILLDPYSFDGRRHIPIIAQPLVQVPEVVVQVLRVLLGRHLVHPRCTAFTGLSIGFQQELTVNQVKHVVEP